MADGMNRVRRGGVALVATLGLLLAACTGEPAPTGTVPTATPVPSQPVEPPPAAAPKTTQRIVFGDPWSSDPKRIHAVAESALEIIDRAKRGQRVTLSMFNMTYAKAADTLIRASRRGVEVHVLVNSATRGSTQVRKLRAAIGTDTKARSWVAVRGGGVRMHSKFLLLSKRGKQRELVWVSSGNLTTANGLGQANEAIITAGDAPLYKFLAEQFELMRRGVTDPERLARTAVTATAIARTFPIPNGGTGNDPIEAALANTTCRHGAKVTTIRLAQLLLTKERVYLTERLRELKARGCEIRIVVHLKGFDDRGRDNLLRAGPGRIGLRSAQGTILHTKIITIDGWDALGEPQRIAIVGTHNLTGRALTTVPQGYNDELSLTISNPKIVTAYSDWVDLVIREHSVPVRAARG